MVTGGEGERRKKKQIQCSSETTLLKNETKLLFIEFATLKRLFKTKTFSLCRMTPFIVMLLYYIIFLS